MNRATVGDFQQPFSLLIAKRPHERNATSNLINHAFSRQTLGAIFRMNPFMREVHPNVFQGDFFQIGIHANGHACARTQAHKQQLIGIWAGIFPAHFVWLVDSDVMGASGAALLIGTVVGFFNGCCCSLSHLFRSVLYIRRNEYIILHAALQRSSFRCLLSRTTD